MHCSNVQLATSSVEIYTVVRKISNKENKSCYRCSSIDWAM